MSAAVDRYLALQKELVLPGRGLSWIDALRNEGAHHFKDVGFPTMRDEDWRHTNVRPIQKREFTLGNSAQDELDNGSLSKSALTGLDAYRVVFVDGRYCKALSSLDGLPGGVTVESLAAAVAADTDEVRETLGSIAPKHRSGFIALNTAFVDDGLYLHVDDDCVVDKPIELVFFSTDTAEQLIQPRNLFIFGNRSRVQIIEHYVCGQGSVYFTNAVSELLVQDSAVLQHTKLQEEGHKAFHVGGVFMHLQAGAQVVSNNIALGSLIGRTDLQVALKAEGASCDLNGVYFANGRQHIDNFTQVDHEKPACKSNEYYKGVLNDRARAVFRGRVVVHQDAQHTDAQQQNKNLLLSADAEVDTKPQLEIYADDVKCSHGATVGQLDEAAIFYLRARAINEATARSLLTYAFAADLISRFSIPAIRNRVESVLSSKLFGGSQMEQLV